MNDAYSNFIQKLTEIIDKVAPLESKRIKRNSQEWFDSEILEKLIIRDKLFLFWILKGFDDGLVTGMILIYLQKTFDTINCDIVTATGLEPRTT